tara:strand:+ start:448 stop:564 length:117 start_codon:yes stop_codon:yes gene_type:complete
MVKGMLAMAAAPDLPSMLTRGRKPLRLLASSVFKRKKT